MDAGRPLSGLVVLVPEADPVVGPHRLRLDASAPLGVPAHVTVLFPFVPPDALDDGTVQRVRAVVAAVPALGYTFDRTDWFDDAVLWPAPADARAVPGAHRAGGHRVPGAPAVRGAFDDVVPHLTVGRWSARARFALGS
jgi:hypothetical protein